MPRDRTVCLPHRRNFANVVAYAALEAVLPFPFPFLMVRNHERFEV